MALFKKNKKTEEIKKECEEWIWVDGYKGMDKDMQCYGGFQYELGKSYDMPEDATIEACNGGFHMCLKLKDVFSHVPIRSNNRFFKVRALVRKFDLDNYGVRSRYDWTSILRDDKLAAKSIEIVQELTRDEILEHTYACGWEDHYKDMALSEGLKHVNFIRQTDKLTECGYSMPFASWAVNNSKYDIAMVVGSQSDLSMDVKVPSIMLA